MTRACLFPLALLLALTSSARAQDDADPERIARVKAAYVLNFIRFTEWPSHAFVSGNSSVVVGFLGEGDVDDIFEQAVGDRLLNGRSVVVRRINAPPPTGQGGLEADERHALESQLEGLHLLYLDASARRIMEPVLEMMGGRDTLTVSDASGFATAGGMLELVLHRSRIVFNANLGEIRETEIKVSSQVLRLARIVQGNVGE